MQSFYHRRELDDSTSADRAALAASSSERPFGGDVGLDGVMAGLPRRSLHRWQNLQIVIAPAAVQPLAAGTKPTILTPDALAALQERIKTPPDDGGLWTGPKIARWLAKFHGVQGIHDQRGWDALIAIGYSISSHGRAILPPFEAYMQSV